MKTKLRIYTSGPMTGIKDKNFPSFMKASLALRRKGYFVINPAELDIGEPEVTWEKCLQRDIRELMKCNAIATLPGWQQSRGAKLEVYIATVLGWPVHSVKYYLGGNK